MLWIDVATPKYALFFSRLIPEFKNRGHKILVTTRFSPDYTEAKAILDAHGIASVITGGYGGNSIEQKLKARLERQNEFLRILKEQNRPQALLCGSVPDSIQTAFGLGISTVNFCDIPVRDCRLSDPDFTAVARLTLPLSTHIFYPFVLPQELFLQMGIRQAQLHEYGFLDVCLWMDDVKADPARDFRKKYGLDPDQKTVLIREEEYKAHYVSNSHYLLEELLPLLKAEWGANLVIMPRYGVKEAQEKFGHLATVLPDTLKPDEFYPFINLMIGGGGTMNLEAAYHGIPVISTRSICSHYDKYLIDHEVLHLAQSATEAMLLAKTWMGKKLDVKNLFKPDRSSVANFADQILECLACAA